MELSTSTLTKKILLLFMLVAGLYFAKSFLIPLSIGVMLATLFLPLTNWLERKKIPRGLAAFICLLILLIFIAGVGWLVGWKVSELANDFTLLKQRGGEIVLYIRKWLFDNFGLSVKAQSGLSITEGSPVNAMIPVMAGSVIRFFTHSILVLVYVFLLLFYRHHLKKFILMLAPVNQQAKLEKVISGVAHVSQQYLVGLAKMIFCLWIMYGIGFSIIGVENALFFAILCGLLEIIPFVGNITGTLLTLLIAAVHGASPGLLLGIVCTYSIVQFIQGWVLEPLIVGPQVKINPLFTILALVVGQLLWGIPGIFVAIPLIAMFKIVSDHVELLQPYGFLVSEIERGGKKTGMVAKLKKWFAKKS